MFTCSQILNNARKFLGCKTTFPKNIFIFPFSIGEVILETVRQKAQYAAQLQNNGHAGSRHAPSAFPQAQSGRQKLMSQAKLMSEQRAPELSEPVRNEHRLPQHREQTRIQHPSIVNRPGSTSQAALLNNSVAAPVLNTRVPINTFTHPTGMPGLNGPGTLGGLTSPHPGLISHPSIKHQSPITTLPNDARIARIQGSSVGPSGRIQQSIDHASTLRPVPQLITQQPSQVMAVVPQPVSPHIKPEIERKTIISKTVEKLNECVPFRVRFKKEPTVRGRIYGFDYSHSRPNPELRVFIEYPIGKRFCIFLHTMRFLFQFSIKNC